MQARTAPCTARLRWKPPWSRDASPNVSLWSDPLLPPATSHTRGPKWPQQRENTRSDQRAFPGPEQEFQKGLEKQTVGSKEPCQKSAGGALTQDGVALPGQSPAQTNLRGIHLRDHHRDNSSHPSPSKGLEGSGCKHRTPARKTVALSQGCEDASTSMETTGKPRCVKVTQSTTGW